jgi:multiple sugar transport system substrate-binding protein
MAENGNFPALMNDEISNIIAGLDGFPTDEASKEALSVSNLYLEVPYAENVSAINDILDTYHKSIMNREITVDEGITAMNDEVGKILGK